MIVHRVQASGLRSLSQKGGNWETVFRSRERERGTKGDPVWVRRATSNGKKRGRPWWKRGHVRPRKTQLPPSSRFLHFNVAKCSKNRAFLLHCRLLVDPRTYTHVYSLNRCTKEDEGEICISREFTYNESVIKIHVALFHGIDARGIGLLRSNLLPRYEASSTLRGRRVRFSSRFSKGRKEKLSLLCIFWRFFLFFFFKFVHDACCWNTINTRLLSPRFSNFPSGNERFNRKWYW